MNPGPRKRRGSTGNSDLNFNSTSNSNIINYYDDNFDESYDDNFDEIYEEDYDENNSSFPLFHKQFQNDRILNRPPNIEIEENSNSTINFKANLFSLSVKSAGVLEGTARLLSRHKSFTKSNCLKRRHSLNISETAKIHKKKSQNNYASEIALLCLSPGLNYNRYTEEMKATIRDSAAIKERQELLIKERYESSIKERRESQQTIPEEEEECDEEDMDESLLAELRSQDTDPSPPCVYTPFLPQFPLYDPRTNSIITSLPPDLEESLQPQKFSSERRHSISIPDISSIKLTDDDGDNSIHGLKFRENSIKNNITQTQIYVPLIFDVYADNSIHPAPLSARPFSGGLYSAMSAYPDFHDS